MIEKLSYDLVQAKLKFISEDIVWDSTFPNESELWDEETWKDTLVTKVNEASARIFKYNSTSPITDLTNPFIYGGGANALICSAASLERVSVLEYYSALENGFCKNPEIRTYDNFKFKGSLAGRHNVFEMSDCPPNTIVVLNMNFLTAIKVIII